MPLEILSRDKEIDDQSIISRAIYLGDTADRFIYIDKKMINGYNEQKSIFLFKKYLALYLIKLCAMVDLNKKLIGKNKILFSDIRFLATLGNHDYGEMLWKDFRNTKFKIDYECIKKISSLCQYFISTELVIKEGHQLHVFSHSGATCKFFLDNCFQEVINHQNFNMHRTFYPLNNKEFYTDWDFQLDAQLTEEIENFFKSIKRCGLWDVHTWCDFDFCVNNEQEVRVCKPVLIDNKIATNRPILCGGIKSWLSFFKTVIEKNYLTKSEKITFYRGHQHSSEHIRNVFFEGKCCGEYVKDFSQIIFKFFPPCFMDNIFYQCMHFLTLKHKPFENHFYKRLFIVIFIIAISVYFLKNSKENNFDEKLFIVIFISTISIYFYKIIINNMAEKNDIESIYYNVIHPQFLLR